MADATMETEDLVVDLRGQFQGFLLEDSLVQGMLEDDGGPPATDEFYARVAARLARHLMKLISEERYLERLDTESVRHARDAIEERRGRQRA